MTITAALLVQILCALIGQTGTIVNLIEKLKSENRDTLTPDEVETIKAECPVAHQMLLAATGQPSCQTCASVVGATTP